MAKKDYSVLELFGGKKAIIADAERATKEKLGNFRIKDLEILE
jgi:hypothetical protein